MRILVTGGNGFIGSHFVAAAVDAGHVVTVLDLTATPRFAHGRVFKLIESQTTTLQWLPELLSGTDVVCHFAYSTVPSTSNADPVADITGNLISSVQLLQAMHRANIRHILYLSSGGAVYGPKCLTPIEESHPLNPISSYGVTKVAFEKYLGMYATLHGLKSTIVRPSNPYGPGQGKIGLLGAVSTFLHAAATGNTATIWGDGSQVRDFVHVDDLSRLLVAALEQDRPGTYNCGRGVGTSILELMSAVERVTGKSIRRTHLPVRAYDPPKVILDLTRARENFGWAPRVDLQSGLASTWDWMQQAHGPLAPSADEAFIKHAFAGPLGTAG